MDNRIKVFGNPDAADFVKYNLTQIKFLGHNVMVHKLAKHHFLAWDLAVTILKNESKLTYDFKDVQTYCNRNMRGSTRKSNHAFGIAVDINPETNHFYIGWSAVPTPAHRKMWIRDIPQIVIDAAKQTGFSWGGFWLSLNPFKTRKDFMHFEILKP